MSRNPYVRPVSKTTWYMRQGRYKKYMLREVTCLLVGFYSFLAIFALAALRSPEAWASFLQSQQNGFMVGFHAFGLSFKVQNHSVTHRGDIDAADIFEADVVAAF